MRNVAAVRDDRRLSGSSRMPTEARHGLVRTGRFGVADLELAEAEHALRHVHDLEPLRVDARLRRTPSFDDRRDARRRGRPKVCVGSGPDAVGELFRRAARSGERVLRHHVGGALRVAVARGQDLVGAFDRERRRATRIGSVGTNDSPSDDHGGDPHTPDACNGRDGATTRCPRGCYRPRAWPLPDAVWTSTPRGVGVTAGASGPRKLSRRVPRSG